MKKKQEKEESHDPVEKFQGQMDLIALMMKRYRWLVVGAVVLTFIVTFIQLLLFG